MVVRDRALYQAAVSRLDRLTEQWWVAEQSHNRAKVMQRLARAERTGA